MLKKLQVVILVFLLAFVHISIGYTAEDQPGATPAKSKKKAPVTRIYGVVKEMTDNTLKVTLEKGATTTTPEEMSITLNDKTKIRKGRNLATIEDIKMGEQVMVNYREQDGEKVASFVRILVGKKKKAMKEAPMPEEPAQEEPRQEEPSTEGEQNQ